MGSYFSPNTHSILDIWLSGESMENYPLIIPNILSVMVTSPGKVESTSQPTPRGLNRTLISWGFNSTTFTAEPIGSSAQWSIVVEKNSSKIGDINSGYLFGVGVASDILSSKDQVSSLYTRHFIITFLILS